MNETILTTVVMIVLMALSIFIFIFFSRRQEKKRTAALTAEFQKLARFNGINPTVIDHLRNRVIGFDPETGTLLYVSRRHHVYGSSLAQLNEHSTFECIKVGYDQLNRGAGSHFEVKEINLHISSRTFESVAINFFNEVEDGAMALPESLAMAEKWKSYLQAFVS